MFKLTVLLTIVLLGLVPASRTFAASSPQMSSQASYQGQGPVQVWTEHVFDIHTIRNRPAALQKFLKSCRETSGYQPDGQLAKAIFKNAKGRWMIRMIRLESRVMPAVLFPIYYDSVGMCFRRVDNQQPIRGVGGVCRNYGIS